MKLIFALLAMLPLACGGQASAGRVLTLTGSSTIAPLAAEMGLRFEAVNPGSRVDVQSGGSSRGIADVRAGHADIGMASRALAASEEDLTPVTIARDGVALIVHADNVVTELTSEQVRRIYLGEASDWSEFGGTSGPITVVNKAEGRATLTVFLEHFGLDSRAIQADVIAGENEQAIKTVAGTPGAIGYVSIGTAMVDREAGVTIKLLALDGVQATHQNVSSGAYPLSRPLNLVLTTSPSPLALEFIEFARAPEQNDLILRESFVPMAEKL
jgi:phosphate transport system substrate-binding protein